MPEWHPNKTQPGVVLCVWGLPMCKKESNESESTRATLAHLRALHGWADSQRNFDANARRASLAAR